MGVVVHPVRQSHAVKKFLALLINGPEKTGSLIFTVLRFDHQGFCQCHILQCGILGKQIEVLEYQSKMETAGTELTFGKMCRFAGIKDDLIVYPNGSGICCFKKVETTQKGRLSASGGTDDGDGLSFFNDKGYVFQNFCTIKDFCRCETSRIGIDSPPHLK